MTHMWQLTYLSIFLSSALIAISSDWIQTAKPPPHPTPQEPSNLTALQQHVQFWAANRDDLITTKEVYTGFRSLGGLLINLFFSYSTHLAHSYLPDPRFRIHVNSVHKAKHCSDTGIYDSDENFRPRLFDGVFDKCDSSGTGSLGVADLFAVLKSDRVVMDPAGWSFAFMEWGTTWLLLQKGGRVWKDDLRGCYDGSSFWGLREESLRAGRSEQGYGWGNFVNGLREHGIWKKREYAS